MVLSAIIKKHVAEFTLDAIFFWRGEGEVQYKIITFIQNLILYFST